MVKIYSRLERFGDSDLQESRIYRETSGWSLRSFFSNSGTIKSTSVTNKQVVAHVGVYLYNIDGERGE